MSIQDDLTRNYRVEFLRYLPVGRKPPYTAATSSAGRRS